MNEKNAFGLLGLHQFETIKVGEIGADLLSSKSLGPVGSFPFLLDLSLSQSLAKSAFTSAVWDLDSEFGQIERLQVDGLTTNATGWSIDEGLDISIEINIRMINFNWEFDVENLEFLRFLLCFDRSSQEL